MSDNESDLTPAEAEMEAEFTAMNQFDPYREVDRYMD